MERNKKQNTNKKNSLPKEEYTRYEVKIIKRLEGNNIINVVEGLVEHENVTKNFVLLWLLTLGVESYQRQFFRDYGQTQDLHFFVQRQLEGIRANFPNVKTPLKRRSCFMKDRIKQVYLSQGYRSKLLQNHPQILGFKGTTHDKDGNQTHEFMDFWFNNCQDPAWKQIPLHLWEKAHNKEKKNKS
jgi:hypothetical protein